MRRHAACCSNFPPICLRLNDTPMAVRTRQTHT
jgi:hypothetical protein